MKRTTTLTITLLFSCMTYFATAQNFIWPIKGAKIGSNILYQPNDSIDGEIVQGTIFIEAPEGTTVVSPVDGVITSVSITYLKSLNYCLYIGNSIGFDSHIKKIKTKLDTKYFGGSVDISTGGYTIHISGLTGNEPLKIAQKIKKGTKIGSVGYSYHKITQSSIEVSIDKYGKKDNPMKFFGIDTIDTTPKKTDMCK